MLSTHTNTHSLIDEMDRAFDRMRREMDYQFREAFRPFQEFERHLSLPFTPYREPERPLEDREPERALDYHRGNERSLFPALPSYFREFERSFSDFKEFEDMDKLEPPKLEDEEHTYYKMKVMTNHNGHVKSKSMQKEPGKDWQVHMEEYYQDRNKAIEGDKKKDERKAISQ